MAPDPVIATTWLRKSEAARRLGMKDRTIQRLVAEGRLVHKRELDPATKQVALYIDEASIDALARPAPLAVVQPAGAETSLTAPMTLEMLKKLERVEEEIEQRIKELS